MDISFYRWDEVTGQEVTPRVRRKAIAGQGLMLLRVELDPGGCVAMHAHPNEQFGYILEGRIRFSLEGAERELGVGEVYHIPSNAGHEVEAVGDKKAVILDVFHPVREELLGPG
ncbi:MAG: cupin domain-containing protein [Anaerolineae bacterium]|jgi:quercetin dioxygenase-like cupin family protein